ncbi:tetratricopeptide repeat protein [Flavobacterium sp. LC2016-12]|uniref:tetratricopeptide repeat protein n=1 Tax=Flavobacterium sp. LC2016-12 TaxID=2783794 RepID=UPI00188C3016|nr:tetratricopeptide repeat protein [Flavobacterium sp. LC2016-12]MBF4466752.1 tetratricopeptide repeat protein [Flavobacterium sp. LC2016-12]
MNKFRAFLVVLVLVSFKSFACLNWEIKTLKNKIEIYRDRTYQYVPRGHQFKIKDFSSLILDLEAGYKKTNDVDYLSDKGYVLIIQGKYKEALTLYLSIEKIKPNRYSTASNIGTLYELMGENEKAYEWIKKSIKINPESHEGSEWLHLKILEAKIQKLQNLSGAFFINTNFGSEIIPKTNMGDEALAKLKDALYFQLNERITFIKPKDKIISILLFELGNIATMQVYDPQSAAEVYELSKKYGFQSDLLYERLVLNYKKMNEFWVENTDDLQKIVFREQNTNTINARELRKNHNLTNILIGISIFSFALLVCSIVFFLKWKNLKKSISAS